MQNGNANGAATPHRTGIVLERVERIECPHCDQNVTLEDNTPLRYSACPICGREFLVPGRIDGFLLHKRIGEGEMGTIYRATDETLHREVAVKVVRGCLADDPASRERLHKEGVAASRVNHPRVAQVYALNFSREHPYLVMEFVSGLDFAQKFEEEGELDEKTALRMALDVSEGLTALHREGQVHGDIKPGNIVLDRDNNAKLVDFGLSGMMRHDGKGNLVGTPHYLAPELLRGATDTHRSDIYSLGATLYYLLCGKLPFEGDNPTEMLRAKMNSAPIPLSQHAPHISRPTRDLIMQMIENDPGKRPKDSEAVTKAIRAALAQLERPIDGNVTADVLSGAKEFAEHQPFKSKSSVPGLALPGRKHDARAAEISGSIPAGRARQSEPHTSSRRKPVTVLLLCLVAMVEIAVAVKQQSFPQTWEWLRDKAVSDVREYVMSIDFLRKTPPPPPPDLTKGANIAWKSTALDNDSKRGSTMQQEGTLVLQSTGQGMWAGADSGRFVWTRVVSNFVFSSRIQTASANSEFDITALMVKGTNPAYGPALVFGYLGNGKLFLQTRKPYSAPLVVKNSIRPQPAAHLKIARNGDEFEVSSSEDGHNWQSFAACTLPLPDQSTVGFLVSPQTRGSLATAKFADIRLIPEETHPVATNALAVLP